MFIRWPIHVHLIILLLMILSETSLILRHQSLVLASGVEALALELTNYQVVVLSSDSIALFRNWDGLVSALAGGFIRSVTLKSEIAPQQVIASKAGFVGLASGMALLIGLNDVRLYSCNEDALYNRNLLALLPLGDA
jgi:hypothetical protein